MSKALNDFVIVSLFSEQFTNHYSSKTRLRGNPCEDR